MPQLHLFTFYISTCADIRDLFHQLPQENINVGHGNPISIVNYVDPYTVVCSIFSLPFVFHYLVDLGNVFPDVVFDNVTYLLVRNTDVLRHEFFVRIARSFPSLKYLRIINMESQPLADLFASSSDHLQSYCMVEYPHLTSLDVAYSYKDYHEQFLNEAKAYVPCLIELTVYYRY